MRGRTSECAVPRTASHQAPFADAIRIVSGVIEIRQAKYHVTHFVRVYADGHVAGSGPFFGLHGVVIGIDSVDGLRGVSDPRMRPDLIAAAGVFGA